MKLLKQQKFWDSILAVLFIAISSYLVYRLYSFKFLPDKYLYMVICILVLLALIFVLMIFTKVKNWMQWVKRIIIVLLCGLLGFVAISIGHVESSTRKITAQETIGYTNIHVVVKSNRNFSSLSDLSNQKVLLQNGNDVEFANFAKKKLDANKKVKHVEYEEQLDYSSMITALLDEKCDAIIITDSAYQTLGQNIEDVQNETTILHTFKQKKKVNASTSEKDIRYETFTVFITGNEGTGDITSNLNSDVNMLLLINPLASHVEMISLPRDSYVPNPALGNRNDKLTHTGGAGSENTVQAMEQLFGFDIDYYLKLNFSSVIEIVDALDGIDIDIPLSFCEQDENRSFDEGNLICLNPGEQRLNGRQALAYARHRHSYQDQDLSRNMAQQQVFQSIIKRMLNLQNVTKIEKLMDIATRLCATNMPIDKVTGFISYQLDHPQKWTFSSISLNNGYSTMLATASMGNDLPLSVYVLKYDDIQTVIDRYYEMCNWMNFSKFKFDLADLNKDRVLVPSNLNFLWSHMDNSPYQAVTYEPEVPEEPITPPTEDTQLPDHGSEVEPTDPQQPEVPEVPEEPEVPPTTPENPEEPVIPQP